jgi:tetratricopeptide (TPR) repeat protein
MKTFWTIGFLSVIVSFAGFASGQTAVKPGQKQFVLGRKLIQSKCVDCMDGSQAGLEEGVRQIEEALKAGYPNKKAAYKLLLNAYANLDTYTEKDPPAHQAYAQKRAQVLKKLVELSSQDPEVLKEYAESLQDPDEKAAVLTKIIALNPNLTDARYELGLITAQKGRVAAGIRMVEDAIAYQADPDVMRNYVQGLTNLLDEVKCPLPDAEQWNTKLNQAYGKATQGAGDPAAMSDFKKRFLEVVGEQPCATASNTD